MRTDHTGRSWFSDVWDWVKGAANSVWTEITNTFGAAVQVATDSPIMGWDNLFFGAEYGENVSVNVVGDTRKPITFFVRKASRWWRFWEYNVGVQINIGDGGIAYNFGVGQMSIVYDVGGTSVEFIMGVNKAGITIGSNTNFKEGTIGAYTHYFIRTIPMMLVGLAITATYGEIIPVLIPLFSRAPVI